MKKRSKKKKLAPKTKKLSLRRQRALTDMRDAHERAVEREHTQILRALKAWLDEFSTKWTGKKSD